MVPMAELRPTLTDLGFEEVKTYLHSGNVVLDPGNVPVSSIPGVVETAITKRFGLNVRVMVRTGDELAQIGAGHPFHADDAEPSLLHVVFLEQAPLADRIATLDPDRSPPDRFEVRDREIYLGYPTGQGRSKLNLDYFERVLGIAGTARNWNTVTKLVDMVG
jgi:uncharacterized protein (DUF1697 family)